MALDLFNALRQGRGLQSGQPQQMPPQAAPGMQQAAPGFQAAQAAPGFQAMPQTQMGNLGGNANLAARQQALAALMGNAQGGQRPMDMQMLQAALMQRLFGGQRQ